MRLLMLIFKLMLMSINYKYQYILITKNSLVIINFMILYLLIIKNYK